jgi:hypothetical protein
MTKSVDKGRTKERDKKFVGNFRILIYAIFDRYFHLNLDATISIVLNLQNFVSSVKI